MEAMGNTPTSPATTTGAATAATTTAVDPLTPSGIAAVDAEARSSVTNEQEILVYIKYDGITAPFPVPQTSTTLAELRELLDANKAQLGKGVPGPYLFEYDDADNDLGRIRVISDRESKLTVFDIPSMTLYLSYDKDAALATMERLEAEAAGGASAAATTTTPAKRGRPRGKSSSNKKAKPVSTTKTPKAKKKVMEEVYVVEEIIDRKAKSKKSKTPHQYTYQVRWKGYGPEDDTWEPFQNISRDLQEHIKSRWFSDGAEATTKTTTPAKATTEDKEATQDDDEAAELAKNVEAATKAAEMAGDDLTAEM